MYKVKQEILLNKYMHQIWWKRIKVNCFHLETTYKRKILISRKIWINKYSKDCYEIVLIKRFIFMIVYQYIMQIKKYGKILKHH